MTEITERHKKWAWAILQAARPHMSGFSNDEIKGAATKLAELEGDPPTYNVDDIATEIARLWIDNEYASNADRTVAMAAKLRELLHDPPKEEVDIRCNSCGKAMERVGDQHIDEGVPGDPNTDSLCGVAVLTPPQGLEDAVTDALLEIGVASKPNSAIMVAAVQPLFAQLQAEVDEHRNHVAGLQSRLSSEAHTYFEARRELQAANDALREIDDQWVETCKQLRRDNAALEQQVEEAMMNDETKIKACPYCGSVPERYNDDQDVCSHQVVNSSCRLECIPFIVSEWNALCADIERGRRYDEDIATLKGVVKCGELALDEGVRLLREVQGIFGLPENEAAKVIGRTDTFLAQHKAILDKQKGQ